MNVLERMKHIIDYYAEDFEEEENHFVKEYNRCLDDVGKVTTQVDTVLNEATYAAQRLGFIEGVQFALDIMSNLNNVDSKKEAVLREFINSMKKEGDINE